MPDNYVLVEVPISSSPDLQEEESCDSCACCWLTHICVRMTLACCDCLFCAKM
jgi:hypothetical protein